MKDLQRTSCRKSRSCKKEAFPKERLLPRKFVQRTFCGTTAIRTSRAPFDPNDADFMRFSAFSKPCATKKMSYALLEFYHVFEQNASQESHLRAVLLTFFLRFFFALIFVLIGLEIFSRNIGILIRKIPLRFLARQIVGFFLGHSVI